MLKTKISPLKIVFLTLFLDLMGFSLIFPMFPSLAKHYLELDGENVFLKTILSLANTVTSQEEGELTMQTIVLFGGILGALYSFLQFVFSPLWGNLSDRIGRRKTLQITTFGMAISYLLWIFSGSFTLLIFSRIIGGIMGGNISVATAVVSDVTPEESRSKGMAIIGISFALGFILGPAIGGILSLVDLTLYFPNLVSYGLNPFSLAAIGAFVLSLLNFLWVHFVFSETLNVSKNKIERVSRFKLFSENFNQKIKRINFVYFVFIAIFSGMEFTLTFLAVERFHYSSLDNAKMFIFIGFVLALVQGGFVRRRAHDIGEEKVAKGGFFAVSVGLAIVAASFNTSLFYLGLFFLALGSSCIIPTLTTLISFNASKNEQGLALGTFRSLGALGRVVGPLLASILFWRFGSVILYSLGFVLVLFPLYLLHKFSRA